MITGSDAPACRGGLALLLVLILASPVYVVAQPHKSQVQNNFHITLPEPEVLRDPIEGRYHVIAIPGLSYLLKPGRPVLPVKVITLKLPAKAEVLSVSVDISYSILPGSYRIMPAPQPRPLDGRRKEAPKLQPDPEVYSSTEFFPEEDFTYSTAVGIDPESLTDVLYLSIKVYPVKYLPAKGLVEYAREFAVSVSYTQPAEPAQTYDKKLVIITSNDLIEAADTLAAQRQSEGWDVVVETVDYIDANYAGVDVQEKIRNFIIEKKDGGYAFFLILGDASHVPVRLAYAPDEYDDNDDPDYGGDGSYVETDLYYADLQGSWDGDGDGKYGEGKADGVDGAPDIFLGRLPANTLDEANAMVNKVINYAPDASWFKRYLFLGTVTFDDDKHPEGEYLKDYIEYNLLPSDFYWVKLYDQLDNLTADEVQNQIGSVGYGFVNFAGHGNPDGWYSGPLYGYRQVYSSTLAASLTNSDRLPIVITMACMTARFYDTVSIGAEFLKNPNGGAIAYFGATRVAWGYVGFVITEGLAGKMDLLLNERILGVVGTSEPWLGPAFAAAIADYVTQIGFEEDPPYHDWKTIAEYGTMFGDPTLALSPMGEQTSIPPPPKLYGKVLDSSGDPVSGVNVSLYNLDTGQLIAYDVTEADGSYEISTAGTPPIAAKLVVSETPDTFGAEKEFYLPRAQVQLDLTVLSKEVPPNTVLLVVDDDGADYFDSGVWPDEISAPIESLGFNVMVFRESEMGEPPLDLLLEVVAVFWHVGTYYGTAVSDSDAETLIKYIMRGGSLVLEGEDIGYDHGSDEFMRLVAHAYYKVDNADSTSVEVSNPDHFITAGLPASMDFEWVPPYPDGVTPVEGGEEILRYAGTSYSAAVAYDGLGVNGSRVVYFAFPLHSLSQTYRDELVKNSILWVLGGDHDEPVVIGDLVHILSGELRINASVTYPDGISSIQYSVDGGPAQNLIPLDGSADEAREDIFLHLNGSDYSSGEHMLKLMVQSSSGGTLELTYRFYVTPLGKGWTIVSIAEPPSDSLTAKDLGAAIGPSCTVISRWDSSKGRYFSYLPGVSPDEYNFAIERGLGYFVFLEEPGVLVWVEGQETMFKEGWSQ